MAHTRDVVIPLHDDGSLRVGIVADTHSQPHEEGLAHLAALKPDVILHAGDIGDLAVLSRLERIAGVHAVRGNIDSKVQSLPDVLNVEFKQGEQRALMVLLTHIAVAGPVIRADAAKRARAVQASLIVCGHSHVPFITQDRGLQPGGARGRTGLTLFNPGSIGPRRFRLPILFGVMDVSATGVKLKHYDAETGREWTPG